MNRTRPIAGGDRNVIFQRPLRGGVVGSSGGRNLLDIDPTHIADLRVDLAAASSPFGVPVLLWVAGDADTPTIGPGTTTTGTPTAGVSPWQLPSGADVPGEDYDGSSYRRQTAGNLDPAAGHDVIIAGTVKIPAAIGTKCIFATKAAGRGIHIVTFAGAPAQLYLTVVGDTTANIYAPTYAENLVHFCMVIDRDGELRVFVNGRDAAIWTGVACPAGALGAGEKATIGAFSAGTIPWNGSTFWLSMWQGTNIATTWLADSAALIRDLYRRATGIGETLALDGVPRFYAASARAWTDHNAVAWTASAHMPRSGNSLGFQAAISGASAEVLRAGRHAVGVAGSHTAILGSTSPAAYPLTTPPSEIVIVAGQSNATGSAYLRSEIPAAYALPRADCRARHYLGGAGVPEAPYESSELEALDSPNSNAAAIVGVEPSLAGDMATAGRRISVAKIAQVGSSLAVDWAAGSTLRAKLVEHTAAILAQSVASVTALVWIQGENDALVEAQANAYQANLTAFIADVRASLSLPTMDVMICRLRAASALAYAATVIAAQDAVIAADAHIHLIDCDAIGIQGDGIHYSDAGYNALGQAIASAILAL